MKGIEMYYTVKTLLDQGWSISGIARELGIDRAFNKEPQVVWRALKLARAGRADFADCLIAQGNLEAGCRTTATLDRDAGSIRGMTLLTKTKGS